MANIKMEPPPILPDIEEDLKSYLMCAGRLPIHRYEKNQQFFPRNPDPKELFHFEGSPLSTTLKVQRDPNTGEIVEFIEAPLQAAGEDAKNSMSMNRAPAPPSQATRGSAMYIPFWPGSFPDPIVNLPSHQDLLNTELLTVPPGFKSGVNFGTDGVTVIDGDSQKSDVSFGQTENVINLLELMQQEQDLLGVWETSKKRTEESVDNATERTTLPEEDELIPAEEPILKISTVPPVNNLKGTDWAVLMDTTKPVTDFKERIPEMAYNYEFELDTFQKLAILQLEKHNHVFVAAHTSAGKTVVAEYAIALSQQHMTRTIYTSPIKALSNQKYRDFKRVFKDVGLITGDFQINPTATCLIMTTEILRSMLYCGSDITRDIEFVIFDEVHYINDRERGHVWEQVMILLPEKVCVVLLSATVPNTIEFADWLGRTHKRKVYVITTYKRPVPLKHYLYTGTGGGTRDNRFLVLDVDEWKMGGYAKAAESLPKDKDPYRQAGRFNPKQEKNLWIGLIDHLKRNDLLPVVAFTFSRVKCDQNSENLQSLDLTTEREKNKIHMFYEECVRSLKEPDRNIPQVIMMRNILNRGIGVHHSGILPIIKEIVEMLFQRGLIKLLFATETFAMGVNMPARTVVFDSLSKHDGHERRLLKPAEYIQMAGRAGRRGLDKEGTVIILCKNEVLPTQQLQQVMMGKPSLLESQFRITYGMVLSLLRVESITVEGMMMRSFREADHQKKLVEKKKDLEKVIKEIEELCSQELSNYLKPLIKFYESARSYLITREEIMAPLMMSSKVMKILTPGKVLLVTHKEDINKLALLLSISKSKIPVYEVLVLTESGTENKTNNGPKPDLWYKMMSLAKDNNIFCPSTTPGHKVITIAPTDILEITGKSVKLDTELVLKDWQKRQIERFKNDPPGQTCAKAIQELHKLSILVNESSVNSLNKLEFLHFLHDLKVNDEKLYEGLQFYYVAKNKLIDHLISTQIPNFEQQFSTVFNRKFLEERKADLEFQLSNASMSLYPDYENRIELLRSLNYIDKQNKVQLKGRVACEMGMNELLITELVFRNILKDFQPAEVVALLSALVFRQKTRPGEGLDDSELTENLKRGIKNISQVHLDIANLELYLQIRNDELQEDLNFGLVKVVYEWASDKPFADIMCLTNIQEGIIVRCIQQLNETICDVRDAARLIGDPELQTKMQEASTAIKRDIVFAASLYTQGEANIL